MTTIKTAVFDWAGTMIDFGSFAPVMAFVEGFRAVGMDVSVAEARVPMGLPKRDHIAAMFQAPRLADAWMEQHSRAADETDIDRVYDAFVPLGEKTVTRYADLVPGALAALAYLRAHDIKVGSTTGYTRSIMEKVAPLAADRGYAPDNMVCADDLAEGRPGPLGMYQCFVDLAVYPPAAVLKVDDTASGIAEGTAAGCPTVGVCLSGNDAGLTVDELNALPAQSRATLRETVQAKLKVAGATHVIDTVADLPDLIEQLNTSTP